LESPAQFRAADVRHNQIGNHEIEGAFPLYCNQQRLQAVISFDNL